MKANELIEKNIYNVICGETGFNENAFVGIGRLKKYNTLTNKLEWEDFVAFKHGKIIEYKGFWTTLIKENKDYEGLKRCNDYDYRSYIEFIKNLYKKCCDEKTQIKEQIDNVNHPKHYTWLKEKCGIEVLDITRHLDNDLGNAVKYILRCGRKEDSNLSIANKTIEDLEKAIFYLKDKIKMIKECNNLQ